MSEVRKKVSEHFYALIGASLFFQVFPPFKLTTSNIIEYFLKFDPFNFLINLINLSIIDYRICLKISVNSMQVEHQIAEKAEEKK